MPPVPPADFFVGAVLKKSQIDHSTLALRQMGESGGKQAAVYGNVTIPFVDRFPQDTEIYRLLTTKPEDKADENQ